MGIIKGITCAVLASALTIVAASQAQAFTLSAQTDNPNWLSLDSLDWQSLYSYSSDSRSAPSASSTSTVTDTALARPQPNAVPSTPTALLGLDLNNNLYQFTYNPQTGTTSGGTPLAISGLQSGEQLLGIDLRPANGAIYGLTSASRIYQISYTQSSASALFVSSLNNTFTGGVLSGVDFNPQADRLRVNGGPGTNQNFRINVDTGDVSVDTALAYAPGDPNAGVVPFITGAAYSNNFAGTTSTVLYDIDFSRDQLVRQDPPNNGTLNTIGPLGVDFGGIVGFDILTLNGQNYSFATNGADLYTIDLNTGTAELLSVGAVGGAQLVGLVALPEPTTGGLAGFGALALFSRLRRTKTAPR